MAQKFAADAEQGVKMENKCQRVFYNMKYRCNNPKDRKYRYYGGKGIKCYITYLQICYLWERDKANKMKQPSIDRVDANKNYTLQNCRFIELKDNRKRIERKVEMPKAEYPISFSLFKEEIEKLDNVKNKINISYRIIFAKGLEEIEKTLTNNQPPSLEAANV